MWLVVRLADRYCGITAQRSGVERARRLRLKCADEEKLTACRVRCQRGQWIMSTPKLRLCRMILLVLRDLTIKTATSPQTAPVPVP